MEIQIVKETESPLLARKVVECKTAAEGATPSRLSLSRRLGTLLKTKEDLIVIQEIKKNYGNKDITIIARVYKDKAMKDKLEYGYFDAKLGKLLEKEKKADAAKAGAEPTVE